MGVAETSPLSRGEEEFMALVRYFIIGAGEVLLWDSLSSLQHKKTVMTPALWKKVDDIMQALEARHFIALKTGTRALGPDIELLPKGSEYLLENP